MEPGGFTATCPSDPRLALLGPQRHQDLLKQGHSGLAVLHLHFTQGNKQRQGPWPDPAVWCLPPTPSTQVAAASQWMGRTLLAEFGVTCRA